MRVEAELVVSDGRTRIEVRGCPTFRVFQSGTGSTCISGALYVNGENYAGEFLLWMNPPELRQLQHIFDGAAKEVKE